MKKTFAFSVFLAILTFSASLFADTVSLTTVIPTVLKAKKGAIGNTYFNLATLPNSTIPTSALLVEGNLGVGTQAPTAKLQINGADNTTAVHLRLSRLANDYGHDIWTDAGNGDTYFDSLGDSANPTAHFRMRAGGTPVNALTILSTGNVGIGTTTPGESLDVANSIRVTASNSTHYNHSPNALTFYTEKGNFPIGAPAGNKIGFRFASNCTVTDNDEIWIGPNGNGQTGHIQLTATYLHLNATTSTFTGSDVYFNTTDQWTTSDITLKKDIVTIPNALDRVCALRGVNFHWKDKNSPQSLQMGVIAQEVEKSFPEVVTGENGKKSVAYERLVGALIEAIKDQQKEINALKVDIAKLKAR